MLSKRSTGHSLFIPHASSLGHRQPSIDPVGPRPCSRERPILGRIHRRRGRSCVIASRQAPNRSAQRPPLVHGRSRTIRTASVITVRSPTHPERFVDRAFDHQRRSRPGRGCALKHASIDGGGYSVALGPKGTAGPSRPRAVPRSCRGLVCRSLVDQQLRFVTASDGLRRPFRARAARSAPASRRSRCSLVPSARARDGSLSADYGAGFRSRIVPAHGGPALAIPQDPAATRLCEGPGCARLTLPGQRSKAVHNGCFRGWRRCEPGRDRRRLFARACRLRPPWRSPSCARRDGGLRHRGQHQHGPRRYHSSTIAVVLLAAKLAGNSRCRGPDATCADPKLRAPVIAILPVRVEPSHFGGNLRPRGRRWRDRRRRTPVYQRIAAAGGRPTLDRGVTVRGSRHSAMTITGGSLRWPHDVGAGSDVGPMRRSPCSSG